MMLNQRRPSIALAFLLPQGHERELILATTYIVEAQLISRHISCEPEQGAYEKRGNNGTKRRKDRDGPLCRIEATQVHVQRPGKQKKARKP
jgi:hypothetical protein